MVKEGLKKKNRKINFYRKAMVPVVQIVFGKLSQRLANINDVETTAGPQIKPFHSTSSCYNIDVCMEFDCCLCEFPPGTSVSSHVPNMCMEGESACMTYPNLSVDVDVGVNACSDERASCP